MDNTDTVHKQLELNALIEFAQLISSKLDLKYILNNILLSNMGKMLISKGMILLKSDDNNENIYSIAAAKGIDQKYLNTDLSVISLNILFLIWKTWKIKMILLRIAVFSIFLKFIFRINISAFCVSEKNSITLI